MEAKHAEQIAHLLNNQNQLAVHYDARRVLESEQEYLLDVADDGRVACCAQLKKVQWYQAELCHVTTHPDFARQGRGMRLIARAEDHARKLGARLIQITIRTNNKKSEGLFEKAGFTRGVTFKNPDTGNLVVVWAKPLYS